MSLRVICSIFGMNFVNHPKLLRHRAMNVSASDRLTAKENFSECPCAKRATAGLIIFGLAGITVTAEIGG